MDLIFSLLFLQNALRPTPLHLNAELTLRAQIRAEQLCRNFSHANWTDSFKGTNYTYIGENLARGELDPFTWTPDPVKIVLAWYESDMHRDNILNTHFTAVGIGYDSGCATTAELFGG